MSQTSVDAQEAIGGGLCVTRLSSLTCVRQRKEVVDREQTNLDETTLHERIIEGNVSDCPQSQNALTYSFSRLVHKPCSQSSCSYVSYATPHSSVLSYRHDREGLNQVAFKFQLPLQDIKRVIR